jgi:hypothetical protein
MNRSRPDTGYSRIVDLLGTVGRHVWVTTSVAVVVVTAIALVAIAVALALSI